jgi:hypothetical protein
MALPAYFNQYPDVAAAYALNNYGLTPEQYAQVHYQNYGANEQRISPQVAEVAAAGTAASAQFPTPSPTPVAPSATVPTTPTNGLLTGFPVSPTITSPVEPPVTPTVESQPTQQTVTDYQGNTYNSATILKLAKQITPSIDPNAVKGGVFSTSGESVGFNYDEATRLLGKAPTASEQVILDMARHLAKEGVTDLSQVDATDTNRRFGSTYTGGGGTIYEIKKDAEGKPIISTWSRDTSDKKTILTGLALAALAFGIPGLTEGLLSSAPAGTTLGTIGAESVAATTVGTTGLTMAELAQLDLALGGVGGTLGAETLAAALTTGAFVPTLTNLTGGSGVTPGLLTPPVTPVTPVTPPVTPTTPVVPPVAPPVVPPVVPPVTPSVIPSVIPPVIPSVIPPALTTALTSLIPGAVNTVLNPTNLGGLLTSGATTAAGLLQQQTSRDAAIAAQAMIDRETTAAKQAAQFRPIGMTTRFGTSQFQVDPVTGQLTSAGYTLSPEAKAQQDRLVALSNAGLTQAEAAQQQFAPLQTGAQNLFNLGNQYIAQSPQDVAQNYLNQQMALLQPGREQELATLQNRLQQQGRGGLSVAQGGTMGATTPELQALFNARAQQEAVLAANAQQAGQQQVLYGAGLLGQGTTAMGNYYAGQQGAYAPYTTAMGQVTGLEALGQQPLNMSTALAQQTSQAGANVGRLGLSGAEFSTRLATSPAATTNPYSTLLGGVGASNQFGQFLGGLFGGVPATTAMSAPATTFGTGNYYGNQDLGLYL